MMELLLTLRALKARALRETIPKMLDPLVQKHASRMDPTQRDTYYAQELTPHAAAEALYNAFMKAVTDAQADITDFTELVRDDESKAIFAQALKSQQEDPTDIKSWRHKDHPSWYDLNGKS